MDIPVSVLEEIAIKRGAILHSNIFDDIDHGKFFVVIGVTEDCIVGFFFINSNINKFIENKPEQLAMQFPLQHKYYAFLKYDSFICATKIRKLSRKDLAKSLTEGQTKIVGELMKEHIEDILEKARHSKLFNKKEKESFLS